MGINLGSYRVDRAPQKLEVRIVNRKDNRNERVLTSVPQAAFNIRAIAFAERVIFLHPPLVTLRPIESSNLNPRLNLVVDRLPNNSLELFAVTIKGEMLVVRSPRCSSKCSHQLAITNAKLNGCF